MIVAERVGKIASSQQEAREVEITVNPLDQRNGRVPSWSEISNEFGLNGLPRGKRKLYKSFYRGHRLLAIGKKRKGRRLLDGLYNKKHFLEFDGQHRNELSRMIKRIRGIR